MVSKNQIKHIASLQHKKFRDNLRLFVAEGDKCISELRKAFHLELLVTPDDASADDIRRMSFLRTPQGSIAVFRMPEYTLPKTLSPDSLVLALDGVQDPGNLGTIIRTADWFGVHDIVCSRDTADCFNPKVVQATMGSLARVRVHYTDLPAWLAARRNEKTILLGTLLDGTDLYATVAEILNNPRTDSVESPRACIVIVMGNEGNGLSAAVRTLVTHPVCIPPYPADASAEHAESLNVAIATAVILAEFRHPGK